MKKVLIDGTYYQSGDYHGGGEYGNVVLDRLLKIQGDFGIAYYSGLRIEQTRIEECKERGWMIYPIETFSEIPDILEKESYEVFYSPLPYQSGRQDVRLPANVKYIATIHGLRFIELLDYIGLRNGNIFSVWEWKDVENYYKSYIDALLLSENRIIVAVSEHSKYSIYNMFPETEGEQIEVLYSPMKLSDATIKQDENEVLHAYGLEKDNYALLVSGGIWYKNVSIALAAYDQIISMRYSFLNDNYKVVVTGVKDASGFENILENRDHFVLLDYVDSDTLNVFYKNAQLFMFPSLNEGFGYPPFEAMKYGTICACAADSSIMEVCGDTVLYFNPVMINEIKNRILQSFSDQIRKRLKQRMEVHLPRIRDRQKEDLDRLVEIIVSGGEILQ